MDLTVVFRLTKDGEDLGSLPLGSKEPKINDIKIIGGLAYRVIDKIIS